MNASTATAVQQVVPIRADEPERSLRALILDAIETDPSLTQARIAREIGAGVSAATLNQWLNDHYKGNHEAVEARISSWWETYQERRSRAGLPDAPDWVKTPTAERILGGLRYAQLAQDVVVIYGPAGVSKSETAKHYQRTAPAVFHVTMTPATRTVLACLTEIAIALGIRDLTNSASALQRAIVAKLRNTNGVLLIDEAQHLDIQALDQVRSIHDATQVGVVLMGNEQVYTRMTGGNRAAYLDRLFSRVGKRIQLRAPSDADIDAIVAAWRITDTSCRAQLREIARKPGGLRVLTKVLRLAASFAAAQERKGPPCCDDVRAAWRDLGAME